MNLRITMTCLLITLSSCGSDIPGSDVMYMVDGGGTIAPPTTEEACLAGYKAITDVMARCGSPGLGAYMMLVAERNCADEITMRDTYGLYHVCIPWFEAASCDDATTGSGKPEECSNQVQRLKD